MRTRVVLVLVLALALACSVPAYAPPPPAGAASPKPPDSTVVPHGPGLVLMGRGDDVDAAFLWLHDVVAGSRAASGRDLVILRADDSNAYDGYIARLARFDSVHTHVIASPPTDGAIAEASDAVAHAEAVFFAGGDQSDYVGWRGSKLMNEVAAVYARGGVVGGTSAGCAILGQYVFDAIRAGSRDVTTARAVANPFDSSLSFTRDLFTFPPLAGTVTDPHFATRDRFGRLAAFMARAADAGVTATPVGIGVDEGAALVVDANGVATLLQQTAGEGSAYIVRGGAPARLAPGAPLAYPNLDVTRLATHGASYDLAHHCGDGTRATVAVDGTKAPPYVPADPYGAAGEAAPRCN